MISALPLLVVAFIAGHRFCMKCLPFRYQLTRLEGYHLYFHAGFWGLVITLAASLAVFFLTDTHISEEAECGNALKCLMLAYLGFMESGLGSISVLLALVIADLLAHCWNWLRYRNDAALTALLRSSIKNGSLEMLLLHAHESGLLLMVTLDTGAVYVGYVVHKPDPIQPAEHLRIMPVCSGYRNPRTQEVAFTHDYTLLLELTRQADPSVGGARLVDFIVSFPVFRVASARVFNPSVYDLINPQAPNALSSGKAPRPS